MKQTKLDEILKELVASVKFLSKCSVTRDSSNETIEELSKKTKQAIADLFEERMGGVIGELKDLRNNYSEINSQINLIKIDMRQKLKQVKEEL